MLDHVGIAVQSSHPLRKILEILGYFSASSEVVPMQGVRAHFFLQKRADFPVKIELLESIDPAGPVGRFIERHGPGVHHLSFVLERGRLHEVSQTLLREGYQLVYSTPKRGAHAMNINFIHPSSTGGVLIEIMEPGESSS